MSESSTRREAWQDKKEKYQLKDKGRIPLNTFDALKKLYDVNNTIKETNVINIDGEEEN